MSVSSSGLQQEVQQAETLQYITDVLADISALKIGEIRAGFERNTKFYQEIAQMYHVVKVLAARRNVRLEGVGGNQKSKESKEVEELRIVLTSNRKFYGQLNLDTMRRFLDDLVGGALQFDCWVVGETGQEILHKQQPNLDCREISFVKDDPNKEEKRRLIEETRAYSKVLVYYPKFVTVFTQEVGSMDVAQKPLKTEVAVEPVDYIFEPELPEILQFFEDEVRYILLDRLLLETQLSRVAARLWAMSAARERADEMVSKKRSQLNRAVRSARNARLLDSLGALIDEV